MYFEKLHVSVLSNIQISLKYSTGTPTPLPVETTINFFAVFSSNYWHIFIG